MKENTTWEAMHASLKCCTKAALALDYLPHLRPHSATNRLAMWINSTPELLDELKATGYTTSQRLLTVRQVDIITRHLGEP